MHISETGISTRWTAVLHTALHRLFTHPPITPCPGPCCPASRGTRPELLEAIIVTISIRHPPMRFHRDSCMLKPDASAQRPWHICRGRYLYRRGGSQLSDTRRCSSVVHSCSWLYFGRQRRNGDTAISYPPCDALRCAHPYCVEQTKSGSRLPSPMGHLGFLRLVMLSASAGFRLPRASLIGPSDISLVLVSWGRDFFRLPPSFPHS